MAGWFKDEAKKIQRKFENYETAREFAFKQLIKSKEKGNQTQDRFYIADGYDWYSMGN